MLSSPMFILQYESASQDQMAHSPQPECPVCDSRDILDCIHIPSVPIYCNVLLADRAAALNAPRGDIDLAFCRNCGHLFNAAFDPQRIDYTEDYENSLHFSPRFQEYARSLAEQLIARYDLRHKIVIEIACGKGDFLKLLCELGENQAIGFDPSYVSDRSAPTAAGALNVIKDYYSEAYAGYRADLICCRHALEHIHRPREFLATIRRAIGDNPTAVFFETPNALYTLEDLGIWDLIYEHCGYFCAHSLATAFRRSGFEVRRVESAFGNQFLHLDALPAPPGAAPSPYPPTFNLLNSVQDFARQYRDKVDGWQARLRDFQRQKRRAVLWGAGSKGVTFLNVLNAGQSVDYVVDLNPYKQGRFVPGTGHEVVSPDLLTVRRPAVVIVMNPNYAEEIGRTLTAMSIQAELIVDSPNPPPGLSP